MLTIILVATGSLVTGAVLGYLGRRIIAKKKSSGLESKLEQKVKEAQEKSKKIVSGAKEERRNIIEEAEEEGRETKKELLETEKFLREKEKKLDKKSEKVSRLEDRIRERVKEIQSESKELEGEKENIKERLESLAKMSEEEAKEELIEHLEEENASEILEKIRKLERGGEERLEARAKSILASAIQRYALSQAQEITSTNVHLPDDDLKGRIIGKGGRNIKVLERLTGTEIVVDDTPETVLISAFNPIRRQVAKLALERLMKDGRIQPTRIENEVEKAEKDIKKEVKKAGEKAAFQVGVVGLDKKLVQLLGRLHFRSSYGQNVLLHSIEVAELSGGIANEIGADSTLAKRAGLLHDIGKSVDREIEGSHVDIGIKVLKKFGEKQEVVDAMKSHHEDYEPEIIEAVIVQAADQISGARPGARKDSLDEYLKRLENLEKIATTREGVKDAYAIQAGRELRVFVDPEKINDLEAYKMAKNIVSEIERELKYPGKIKVNLIRENRVTEYAK